MGLWGYEATRLRGIAWTGVGPHHRLGGGLSNVEYTSKTCCNCGTLHQKLGGSKSFRCAGCGFHADRDIHAAFNIFLKFLKETSASICW
jgi:hypothetical protein